MVTDRLFKLDTHFDLLITPDYIYILHPTGFERVAEIETFALARAQEIALSLGDKVKFLDFTSVAEFVGGHKRAARLIAALSARDDLGTIKRTMFCKAATETGVTLVKSGRRMAPARGSEIGCLEILDDRRYTTTLKPGPKPAFVAGSRRRIGRLGQARNDTTPPPSARSQ